MVRRSFGPPREYCTIRPLLTKKLRPFHQSAIDAGYCGAVSQFHRSFEFGMQDRKYLLDTRRAINCQPPKN